MSNYAVGKCGSTRAARCLIVAALPLLAHAQARPAKELVLNLTALDGKGNPVTDLAASEIQLFDEGKPKPTASFRGSGAQTGSTLILWDLLNGYADRQKYTSNLIIHALEPQEKGGSISLYLLTNRGEIYPVHGLPPGQKPEANAKEPEVPWTRQIHSLLDQAIEKVYGLRPPDATDTGIRAATTLQRVGAIAEMFSQTPGPKTLVWITRGVPNWIAYPHGCQDADFLGGSGKYLAGNCTLECRNVQEGKCVDYTPFFHHFGAALNGTGLVVFNVELTPEGVLPPAERGTEADTLHQLADLTGGRIYQGSDVERAISQSVGDARARYRLECAAAADGKYHRLRVTCTRKGVKLDAPRGYFAEKH